MRQGLFFLLLSLALLSGQAQAEDKKVELFVTSWCPYCSKLEGFLKSHNIDYKRYDVERDADGGQIFMDLEGEGVPMVRVGSTVIRGYDPEALMTALQTANS